jgi:alkylresorcinol/alkylpyrone synthase
MTGPAPRAKNARPMEQPMSAAHLVALATATPPFVLTQKEVAERASVLFGGRGDIERLLPVFANAGIERRYSCVPIGWYLEDHGWKERNRLFLDHAVALLNRRVMPQSGKRG